MAASLTDRAPDADVLAIGDVARRSGIPSSTIRYYEQIGLLPAPARASGRRRYKSEVLTQLAMIKLARDAGFSLDEIKLLLAEPDPSRERWQQLSEDKLRQLDADIVRLRAMRKLLEQARACGCLELSECALVLQRLDSS